MSLPSAFLPPRLKLEPARLAEFGDWHADQTESRSSWVRQHREAPVLRNLTRPHGELSSVARNPLQAGAEVVGGYIRHPVIRHTIGQGLGHDAAHACALAGLRMREEGLPLTPSGGGVALVEERAPHLLGRRGGGEAADHQAADRHQGGREGGLLQERVERGRVQSSIGPEDRHARS